MMNNRNRGISRLGLIFNMSVNATTEMRNKNGPHPSTIPTIKRTTELVSTSAKPLKRPGEGETCVVDDETCVIDCETCVVDDETCVIDCETCVVDPTSAGSATIAPTDPENVLLGAAIIKAIPTKIIV